MSSRQTRRPEIADLRFTDTETETETGTADPLSIALHTCIGLDKAGWLIDSFPHTLIFLLQETHIPPRHLSKLQCLI